MPGPDDPTRRLDALLEDLLGDRPLEAAPILSRISRSLSPTDNSPARMASAQARIARRLRAASGQSAYSTETTVRAACVMHLSGVPAHRLVHFLSASLPGSITLPQFELMVRFIFDDAPPVSQQLVYDITQYTYLEKKLLAQRSVELAGRLKGLLTPQVLLYLYLLSLRDDLSNENVHLIFLILRICFPALKVRGRAHEISAAEQREVAAAWKNAQKSGRYAGILSPSASEKTRAVPPRESASYFLDKYFSDQAPSDGPARSALRQEGRPRQGRRAEPKAARRTAAAAPRSAQPAAATKARAERRAPAAAPKEERKAERKAARRAGNSVLKISPFVLAAAVLALGVIIALREARQVPQAPPSVSTAPALQGSTEVRPAPETRVVQKGDSLWKIYRSLKSDGTLAGEWKDFLRTMKQRNGLPDPDRIYPGNVLSITTPDQ